MLFYGQEHYDTLAILSDKKDMSHENVKDLMQNQRLFSNKDLIQRNFGELIENLRECELYIDRVTVSLAITDLLRVERRD